MNAWERQVKRRNGTGGALTVLLGMMALPAHPATTVTVSVTVLAPLPCVINNGNEPIEVDFGDEVMTTRIDGNNYRSPVKFELSCSTPGKSGMRLQMVGEAAAFDSQLLRTSVTGLGVALVHNGTRIPLNRWYDFTYPNLPVLEAVPVKQAGTQLPTGAFTATATLRVDYQ